MGYSCRSRNRKAVENPAVDYTDNGAWVLPGPLGAHNWQAMSIDLEAGLAYIPTQENPFSMQYKKIIKKLEYLNGPWSMEWVLK